MRKLTTLMIAAMIAAGGSSAALATEYTKGVVKKVDMKAGKVTIIHEELTSLDMPAMTMVFRTADPAMLEKMKPGDDIEFVADRVKGKLTVTGLK
jgi:Cu/Ag efflux protein CusF